MVVVIVIILVGGPDTSDEPLGKAVTHLGRNVDECNGAELDPEIPAEDDPVLKGWLIGNRLGGCRFLSGNGKRKSRQKQDIHCYKEAV
jgi:hypothetical protein